MILTAVFLVSLSSLAFEVLLTRVFSIAQWNHLSFMVISIALFGFAASGTFLSILDTRKKGGGRSLSSSVSIKIIILLFTLTAIVSFFSLNRIPLDYFRLPLEPVQALYLLITYLLLSLPFFFTGLIVSLAYAFSPEKTGHIYFASMAGSACGAILPVPLLSLLGEGRLILLAALIPLILVPFDRQKKAEKYHASESISIKTQVTLLVFSLGIAIITVILIVFKGGAIVDVKPSPYKFLSQCLQYPDTKIAETAVSLRGRIDSLKSPYIRFSPGLSLKFTNILPEQHAVFRDGDDPFFLYNLPSQHDAHFTRFTITYSGYLLIPKPKRVLLIQHGGGLGIPCAIASGARKVTIVEQNPHIARIVQSHYKLPVINQNPRAFLAQSKNKFNIIHVENWGTSLPGSASLTQGHLFTKEAFAEYLNHLTERGILIISRKLLLPPADSIRLWAAAYESMKSLKTENPEDHIAILRNWDTFTLIVSAAPLKDTSVIYEIAKKLNFDVVFIHDITRNTANKFNIFDEPYHFLEINRLAQAYTSGKEKEFFQTHFLDVKPQTDNRPFPSRFLKWSGLKKLYKSTGSRLYSLLLSGEMVIAVVFVEALLIALFILAAPLLVISKGKRKPSILHILYFLSVGAGFMFVELFFIKEYTLLFGDPIISFTVVLAGVLVFSGAGGFCSRRLKRSGLQIGLIALIAVLIFIFFGIDPLIHKILTFSIIFRYIFALLLLIPSGFLMGLPFPLGMRNLVKNPSERAYGWSANGCASVLTSIVSAQIALSHGIRTIIACAILAYLIVLVSSLKRYRNRLNI